MTQHIWKDLAYLVSVRNVFIEFKSYSQFNTRGKKAYYGQQNLKRNAQTSDFSKSFTS